MAENARNIPSLFQFWTRFYSHLNTPSSASMFPFIGAFSNFTSPQFTAAFSTLSCSISHLIQMQFITYFNQTIALKIPLLTTFLQLKYQGNNDQNNTPFATHPTTMHVAVCSSVLYYLSHFALLRLPLRHRFAVVARHCLVWSGYAMVATLASVLVPASFSPFVYAVFVLLSASELLYWLYRKLVAVVQVQRRRIHRFPNYICRVVGNSCRPRQRRLPV